MKRQYMIDYRKDRGIDLATMAAACKCSECLLRIVEADERNVTHPKIADRIRKKYRLTKKQYLQMIPREYRGAKAQK